PGGGGGGGTRVPARGEVEEILLPRDEGAVAHAAGGRGGPPPTLPPEAARQLRHDAVGDQRALTGVDEAEQDQVAQEHPPPLTESLEEAPPVQPRGAGQEKMRHVGA